MVYEGLAAGFVRVRQGFTEFVIVETLTPKDTTRLCGFRV